MTLKPFSHRLVSLSYPRRLSSAPGIFFENHYSYDQWLLEHISSTFELHGSCSFPQRQPASDQERRWIVIIFYKSERC